MGKSIHEYRDILKKTWGYNRFRPAQEEIIMSIAQGKDTLGLLPTGGGKSITFQVPALGSEGTCIVVTPLIALMIDQVQKLKLLGVKAAAIHSGVGRHEMQVLLENTLYGAYKLVYVSPERIANHDFKNRLQHMEISFFAIDEAHCISQWGYDFRPSYLKLSVLRELKPGVPILALTATATPRVVDDIQLKLGFKEKNVVKTDFSRSNLVYYVRHSESKVYDLIQVVNSIRGSGIVYCRNRKKTKEIADELLREGIKADYYHAGLNYELREQKQEAWLKGITRIIVATNAFGMGIDKPDVRFVVHVDLPESLEEYFQEAGRAGRDEKKAFAVLFSGGRDKQTLKKRLTDNFPEIEFIKKVYNALCNYLQIPIGGGKGIAFDFDLHSFVRAYKLNPLQTFNALKIIEQQGYLEVTDEMLNQSRIYFTINRDDLYKFQVANKKFDAFIKLVLRSYTGLFSEYTPIREELLAKRAGLTRDMVYQFFVRLAKMNVIQYIPGKRTALVVFTEERLPDKSVYISPENYVERKKRMDERLKTMEYYAFNSEECRVITMLKYFGQDDIEECGQCDYCRSKGIVYSENEINQIREELEKILKDQSLHPKEIFKNTKFDSEVISYVVRMMLDEELIVYDDEGRLMKTNKQ